MPTRSPARTVPWAAIPLFQNLSKEERERLRPLALIRSFEPGERVFGEGDPADQLHFILAGRFKIVKGAADGKEIILEILGPGDPIGVVAVLEGKPLPAIVPPAPPPPDRLEPSKVPAVAPPKEDPLEGAGGEPSPALA